MNPDIEEDRYLEHSLCVSNPRVSVILCTRGGCVPGFGMALRSLEEQDLERERWDCVLVVNGPTIPLELEQKWTFPMRVVQEDREGLIHARVRGLRESGGDLVVWMDDDACFASDYLSQVLNFFAMHPDAAIIGASVLPSKAGVIPPLPLWRALSLQPLESSEPVLDYSSPQIPLGIGMAIKRSTMERWVGSLERSNWKWSLGRVGTIGGAGEDVDLVATAIDAGECVWLNHQMRLWHIIPSHRIRYRYLRRLIRENNNGRDRVLRAHGYGPVPKPVRFECLRIVWHFIWSVYNGMLQRWDRVLLHERSIIHLRRMKSDTIGNDLSGKER
jgi:glycosyltransferase involved in cell wall biosynthesis